MKKYFKQETRNIVPDIWLSAAELSEGNQSKKSISKRRTVSRAAGNSWLRVSNRDKV